ncbi:HNH endonuclease [Cellulosimicrobium sp. TH-20]|uniref:HNH endonuclease n=1 Tax=Cellulosimicrobium sp. TH-20 TaxID=1980001 RepID=UPI001642C97C|nr:HNH endonuclease signature motif containing protein [Cellulosimicrobium sp. TH-20]
MEHVTDGRKRMCSVECGEFREAKRKAWGDAKYALARRERDPEYAARYAAWVEGSRARQRENAAALEARGHVYESARLLRVANAPEFEFGISWRAVAGRDGMTCYLCGQECDRHDKVRVRAASGRYFTRCGARYPTVDHVVALAAGGSHTFANVRLACLGCNVDKGVGDAEPVEALLA